MSGELTAKEIEEFNGYLKNCTDAQVRGVWQKETDAGREAYAALACNEACNRGILL